MKNFEFQSYPGSRVMRNKYEICFVSFGRDGGAVSFPTVLKMSPFGNRSVKRNESVGLNFAVIV